MTKKDFLANLKRINMLRQKEERKFPRLNAYHLAKYRLVSKPQDQVVVTSIKDISGGGTCMRVEEKLPVSSVIQLYINFPQFSHPIPSLAKVIWIKKVGRTNRYDVGIQFLEIEEVLHREIVKRIDYVSKIIKEKGGEKNEGVA